MSHQVIIDFLDQAREIMTANKGYLIDLDSVVGDGDLGLTMSDGFLAAYDAVKEGKEADAGKLLYQAGKAMSVKVPSTMGTLMASGLMEAGKALKGKVELNDSDIAALFEAYQNGVEKRGKAKVGEKTFLDGFDPAVKALVHKVQSGGSIQEAAVAASEAAITGFKNTTTMVAVHGRAATRGEQSRGLMDPGAAVAMLLMQALVKAV